MMIPFRVERLANGIELTFCDCTNRYYGDYHRVRIEVRIRVPLPTGMVVEGSTAGNVPICLVKHLERMGVPGAELEVTRNRLADDYWQHAGPYLARAGYPARLAAAEAAKRGRTALNEPWRC